MSWTGASSIRSISPDSNAATRVEADSIGSNTIRVISIGYLSIPHQSSLRSNTVRVSWTRSTSSNGPVPLALRTA